MSTPATVPITRRVRAYFAPVDRASFTPTLFDAAQLGSFALNAPPAPWLDLGWCANFKRTSGSKLVAIATGAPATTQLQARTHIEATVAIEFATWGKLQLALASGSQQMNLLATATNAVTNGSGGPAAPATALASDGSSTATQLSLTQPNPALVAGTLVAVDIDYTGQTGFVGTGISAAYVRSGVSVQGSAGGQMDASYIRRVTLNVARIVAVNGSLLQLDRPLPAGAPTAGMKVAALTGFVDREGGSFFQEWSALFVLEGQQGDRVLFHYPRLQSMQGSAEAHETLAAPLEQLRLSGLFRALPVTDANDGEAVLCFRSYLPAAMRTV